MATIEIIVSPSGSVAVKTQGDIGSKAGEFLGSLERALGQPVSDGSTETARPGQPDFGTQTSR